MDDVRRQLLRNLAVCGLHFPGRVLPVSLAFSLGGCVSLQPTARYIQPAMVTPQDSVIYEWLDFMLRTTTLLGLSPLIASRGYAMACLSGYLAIGGRYTRLPHALTLATSEVPELAFGVAFSHALEEAWDISLASQRRDFIDRFKEKASIEPAIQNGVQAAAAVARLRARDGAQASHSQVYPDVFQRRQDALQWSPTGPFYSASNGVGFEPFARGILPGWGLQNPWIVDDIANYLAAPFPDAHTAEFARQFEKVQQLGGEHSIGRTEKQSEIALFWEDGPTGVTTPGHFIIIATQALNGRAMPFEHLVRYFTSISLAQADAAIVAWNNKYRFDVIRPETAIRFAQTRFPANNRLQQDRHWRSYIPTPAFPAYVSGHSVFGAAATAVMADILQSDKTDIQGTPPDLVNWPKQLTGLTRRWNSLREIAEENGLSREYGGVHWEIDNTQGLQLGRQIAKAVEKSLPVTS